MAISCDDTAFLTAQLTEVETQIGEVRTAMRAVMGGQTYSMDTGQTRISVTRANITELRKLLNSLMNERVMLRQQLGCSGNLIVTPGY